MMIVRNSKYESRTPWSWKQSFSFISVNKKISLILNFWMMEWVWAGDYGGWWCSLACREQLVVEGELVSLVLIHCHLSSFIHRGSSEGHVETWCAQTCVCLLREEVSPVTEGAAASLNPSLPAPNPKGLWSTSWNRDTSCEKGLKGPKYHPSRLQLCLPFLWQLEVGRSPAHGSQRAGQGVV